MPIDSGIAIAPVIKPAAVSRKAYCAWKAADPGNVTGPVFCFSCPFAGDLFSVCDCIIFITPI